MRGLCARVVIQGLAAPLIKHSINLAAFRQADIRRRLVAVEAPSVEQEAERRRGDARALRIRINTLLSFVVVLTLKNVSSLVWERTRMLSESPASTAVARFREAFDDFGAARLRAGAGVGHAQIVLS